MIIKRQITTEYTRSKIYPSVAYKKHILFEDRHCLGVKGWPKVLQLDDTRMQSGMAVLVHDEIRLQLIHQKTNQTITTRNMYAPNSGASNFFLEKNLILDLKIDFNP